MLTAFDRASAVLAENHPLLEASARLLLEKEALDAADLQRRFSSVKLVPATVAPAAPPCSGQPRAAEVQGG